MFEEKKIAQEMIITFHLYVASVIITLKMFMFKISLDVPLGVRVYPPCEVEVPGVQCIVNIYIFIISYP